MALESHTYDSDALIKVENKTLSCDLLERSLSVEAKEESEVMVPIEHLIRFRNLMRVTPEQPIVFVLGNHRWICIQNLEV